jgi:linoleoyl-CoA desaturase
MTIHKPVTFAKTKLDFTAILNKRVNDYFKKNELTRHANLEMIIKTIIMFTLYFGPYGLIVSGVVTGMGWLVLLTVIMGLGLSGIGLSVMHDANHGAYSKKQWVNHSYTNVDGEDEDISPRGVLRLSPHSSWKKMHKYQFIYAWFIYGLMTISWMVYKDFERISRYHKTGLAKRNNANIVTEWTIMIATKMIYVGYIFVIPLVFTPLAWWQILTGIFIMHYITGFILAIIFQPAHVIEGTEYPLPDESNTLETNWAIHQLLTTTNFSNNSRWFSWYVGGLNFQIEHHLFPNICHVHYRNISSIVRDTAREYGLPYKSTRTFVEALSMHGRLLKTLGARP